MGGVGSRAIVLTIVFLLSSQFPFSNSSLNEEAQQFFTEQEVEELYSPYNFDFDSTQTTIVAERPVTEVNVKVELFPL